MNLIGHHLCASAAGRSYRLGAVLPDLLGLYRRRVRPRALAKLWEANPQPEGQPQPEGRPPFSPTVSELLGGMDFHHVVDMHFHRAPLFTEVSGDLRRALLRASDTPGLKRFLPAHVLTELLLDHLAMARDPDAADRFHLDLVEGADDMKALVVAHPLAEEESFATFMARVLDDRFVEDYRTVEGILGRMNRILLRFGQRPLETSEQRAVEETFAEASSTMERRLADFIAAMADLVDSKEASMAKMAKALSSEAPGTPDRKGRPAPGLAVQPV